MCWKNNNSKKEYSQHFKMINQKLENNMIDNIELDFRDLNLSDCYNSESESESESKSESKINCYKNSEHPCNFLCNDDGEIEFFNFVGFQQYILMLETKYLTNNKAKMDLNDLYIKLSRGLIDTFKERFEKLKNSNNNSHIIY